MLKFGNSNILKKLHKNHKGMSLVELIIAVTIMSVAIAPLLYAFAHSAKYNAKAKRVQRATSAAQTVMENIKAYNLEGVYKRFGIDADGNYVYSNRFLFENIASYKKASSLTDSAEIYNADADYNDMLGNYYITGMRMSNIGSDTHLYDVDITLKKGKTEALPTYHVYNPNLDALYEEDSETDGIYAYDPYFVSTACAKKSGISSELVTKMEIKRKTTLVFNDTSMSVKYDFDYIIYGTGGSILANDTLEKSASVDRTGATELRDVYYYYYPAYDNRLGEEVTPGTINQGIIKITGDELYIKNNTSRPATDPVNVYVFKQRDITRLADATKRNVIRDCEGRYKLEVHADDETDGMTYVYDCVQKSIVDPTQTKASILNKYPHGTKKDLVECKADAAEAEEELLTFIVDIKVYDPATDAAHENPLSTMSGTVVY